MARGSHSEETRFRVKVLWLHGCTERQITEMMSDSVVLRLSKGQVSGIVNRSEFNDRAGMALEARQAALDRLKGSMPHGVKMADYYFTAKPLSSKSVKRTVVGEDGRVVAQGGAGYRMRGLGSLPRRAVPAGSAVHSVVSQRPLEYLLSRGVLADSMVVKTKEDEELRNDILKRRYMVGLQYRNYVERSTSSDAIVPDIDRVGGSNPFGRDVQYIDSLHAQRMLRSLASFLVCHGGSNVPMTYIHLLCVEDSEWFRKVRGKARQKLYDEFRKAFDLAGCWPGITYDGPLNKLNDYRNRWGQEGREWALEGLAAMELRSKRA